MTPGQINRTDNRESVAVYLPSMRAKRERAKGVRIEGERERNEDSHRIK